MDENRLTKLLQAKYGRVRPGNGKHGRELQICCPYCVSTGLRHDTNYHLSINVNTGAYHCFRCNAKGHAGMLLGLYEVWSSSDRGSSRPVAPVDRAIPSPHNAAAGGSLVSVDTLPEDHPAIRYLKYSRDRAFDPAQICVEFGYTAGPVVNSGVMYCDNGNKFMKGRFDTSRTLVFPVYANTGDMLKVVGWQSRLLYDPKKLSPAECAALRFPTKADGSYDRPPKYFTAPGFDKGEYLYNVVNARRFSYVVVCEGVFDAMSVGPCAVALLGKSATAHQLDMLKAYWKEVILLLDPGSADADIAYISGELSSTVYTVVVKLQGYKDAGDCPRPELWRQIAAARELQYRKSVSAIPTAQVRLN